MLQFVSLKQLKPEMWRQPWPEQEPISQVFIGRLRLHSVFVSILHCRQEQWIVFVSDKMMLKEYFTWVFITGCHWQSQIVIVSVWLNMEMFSAAINLVIKQECPSLSISSYHRQKQHFYPTVTGIIEQCMWMSKLLWIAMKLNVSKNASVWKLQTLEWFWAQVWWLFRSPLPPGPCGVVFSNGNPWSSLWRTF